LIAEVGLAAAVAAFVGSHLALSHPLRLGLVRNLGEARFSLLYSGVAILTFLMMLIAYRSVAESYPLWIAPRWAYWVAAALMLGASILLVGSVIRNPAFPHPGAEKLAWQPPAGVFAITRHPMNWSFAIWASVHILLWGSPRNLIVAGGILILAIGGSLGQDRKKREAMGQKWRAWESRTSFVPFAALLSGKVKWKAAVPGPLALGGGLALWLVVTWLHAPSVSPVALLLAR
jgi:uncharacterized membrane protein